jgi:hypothetical protein
MIRDVNALNVRPKINASDVPSQQQVEDWGRNGERVALIKAFRTCYQEKGDTEGGYCSLIDSKHTVENAMDGGFVSSVCYLFVPAWIHFKIENEYTHGKIKASSPLSEKVLETEAFCKKMKLDSTETAHLLRAVVDAHFAPF